MHDERPVAASAPMLPEIDALPSAQREPPAADRDADARRGKGRLDVRGHVIGTLLGMGEVGIAFRDKSIEPRFQVRPGARIGVFLHDKAR